MGALGEANMMAHVHIRNNTRWSMDKNMRKVNAVGLETPGECGCDVPCFKHPPVAVVVKAPMIARRNTGHRNYCDGRNGTIHRQGAWECTRCEYMRQDGWLHEGSGKGMV